MKPLIRALLVSITAITFGANSYAMDYQTKIRIFADNVKYAYKNKSNISGVSFAAFCAKNPVYCDLKNKKINQWMDQTSEQQRSKKFWLAIESCMGNQQICPDFISGFGELVCFLVGCAKRSTNTLSLTDITGDSPWLVVLKKTFLVGIDVQGNHIQDKAAALATTLLENIFWFDPTFKEYKFDNNNFLNQ